MKSFWGLCFGAIFSHSLCCQNLDKNIQKSYLKPNIQESFTPSKIEADIEEGLQPIYIVQPGDFASYRNAFQEQLSLQKKILDRVETLGITEISLENFKAIPLELCIEIREKIRKAYPHSPFEFMGEKSTSVHSLCVQDASIDEEFQTDQGLEFFLKKEPLRNSFHLESTQQLIVQNSLRAYPYSAWRMLYLLDAHNKIIEIRTDNFALSDSSNAFKKVDSQNLETLDALGNYYSKAIEKKNGALPWNVYKYSSADGSIPAIYKSSRFRSYSTEAPSLIEKFHFSFAPVKDWLEIQLPITLAWFGPQYIYKSGYFSYSKFFNSLDLVFRNDKEVCAEGNQRALDKWTYYVESGKQRFDCFNKW